MHIIRTSATCYSTLLKRYFFVSLEDKRKNDIFYRWDKLCFSLLNYYYHDSDAERIYLYVYVFEYTYKKMWKRKKTKQQNMMSGTAVHIKKIFVRSQQACLLVRELLRNQPELIKFIWQNQYNRSIFPEPWLEALIHCCNDANNIIQCYNIRLKTVFVQLCIHNLYIVHSITHIISGVLVIFFSLCFALFWICICNVNGAWLLYNELPHSK